MWSLVVLVVLAIPVLAIVLDSPLGKALAARVGERPSPLPDPRSDARIAALEGEVERLSSEVERLSDEAHFMTRLLAERPEGRALPAPDADDGEGSPPA